MIALLLLAAPHLTTRAAADDRSDFTGSWHGTFRPVTKGESTQTVALDYKVGRYLTVTGRLGGARLVNARLQQHPWVYRKWLGHKTEYNIQAELDGEVLATGDKGWNRVYIHLRHGAQGTSGTVCSPIVSRNWAKHDMMPMTMLSFGRVAPPPAHTPAPRTANAPAPQPGD